MFVPPISDFPLLSAAREGAPLTYLDSAATTQKPQVVIDALSEYYTSANANPHRGAYALSTTATELMEQARERVARFIGAAHADEIIFTKNTTEGLNLLAHSFARSFVRAGEEIVLPITEHHSNLLPWQQVAQAVGATLVYLDIDEQGRIPPAQWEKITTKTRLLAIGQVSNVLGTCHPVRELIARVHEVGGVAVVDGAQSVPHMPVDVQALDADFMVFSGHKMLGPMGVGVVYGKRALLRDMPPFLYGGGMVEAVWEQKATFAPPPARFEGGTPDVAAIYALSRAIDYLEGLGMEEIARHEEALTRYALERLQALPHAVLYGPREANGRAGVISFNIKDAHPHDVATILDAQGVAVRSGHHCAHPLMRRLGVTATCRASFYVYNTMQDVDRLVDALSGVRRWLGYGS